MHCCVILYGSWRWGHRHGSCGLGFGAVWFECNSTVLLYFWYYFSVNLASPVKCWLVLLFLAACFNFLTASSGCEYRILLTFCRIKLIGLWLSVLYYMTAMSMFMQEWCSVVCVASSSTQWFHRRLRALAWNSSSPVPTQHLCSSSAVVCWDALFRLTLTWRLRWVCLPVFMTSSLTTLAGCCDRVSWATPRGWWRLVGVLPRGSWTMHRPRPQPAVTRQRRKPRRWMGRVNGRGLHRLQNHSLTLRTSMKMMMMMMISKHGWSSRANMQKNQWWV